MSDALEQARAHFLAGNAHAEAGRVDQAAAAYEAALALAPGRASVLANLGLMRCRQARWEAAVDLLTQATAADPAHTDAWAALGLAGEALGRWEQAERALARAAALGARAGTLSLTRAMCLLRLNRLDEALAALDEALHLDPTLAEAWSQRGHLFRETGRLDEAARCYREALARGAHEALHRYYLAAVTDADEPPAPPEVYAQALFDDYADDFQDHLLHTLRYTAHETLLRPLLDSGAWFSRVLDLGCGTGLCGRLLAPVADAVDGVDIAPAMVTRARASGAYRRVDEGSLVPWLRADPGRADLVVAADVFIYTGPLAPVFDAVMPRLAPGGVWAFSVEQADAGRDLQLRPSLRYAHGRDSIVALAAAHGLSVRSLWDAPIRHDQGRPVMGWYALLQRPA